jgi:GntR family transcriptional regulator
MKSKTNIIVNPSSHIPVYRQIEGLLKDRIRFGDLKPYDKVWSEREMSEKFNVSRMTVRKAVTNLTQQGYLFTRGGKGTFVSEHIINQPVFKLKSFFEEMIDLGLSPDSEVLWYREIEASQQIAGILKVRPGTNIFEIRRLMSANGIPYTIETKRIVFSRCRLLKNWTGKKDEISVVLSGRCHECVARFDVFIEAATLDGDEAQLFNLEEGAPAFCVKRYAFNNANKQISFIRSTYRGDLYRFHSSTEYEIGCSFTN